MTDAWKHEAEISGRTIEEVKSDLWEKPIGTLQQCFGRLFVAMTQALLLTQETYHRYMMTCTNPCDFLVDFVMQLLHITAAFCFIFAD